VKVDVLVGIPCFNEGDTIASLTKAILAMQSTKYEFKVVVIDDGSSDDTVKNALGAGALVVTHKSNRGLGSAFESFREIALKRPEEFFVLIDGDEQFSPLEIASLLNCLIEDGADLVCGSRFSSGRPLQQSWGSYLGNLFASKIVSSVVKSRYTDVSSGFRAYSKKALSLLRNLNSFNFSQHTLLQAVNLGLVVKEYPVSVQYFPHRKTRMASSFTSQSLLIARSVFGSIKELYPYWFYSRLSLISFVPSIIFGVIFALHFLRTGQFSGFIFAGLTSAFLFLIGLLLTSVGLISESLSEMRKDQSRIIGKLDTEGKR
jgi:glycosyltransferase involved in cell wall biosynthesis